MCQKTLICAVNCCGSIYRYLLIEYTHYNKRAVRTGNHAGYPGQTHPVHYTINFEFMNFGLIENSVDISEHRGKMASKLDSTL